MPNKSKGLYRPEFEHDACGVAFVVDMHGRPSYSIIDQGLSALEHLEHRGATGSESDSGDGAGILIQIPDSLYRRAAAALGFTLPPAGRYATGIAFLPSDPDQALAAQQSVAKVAASEGLTVLGWRPIVVDDSLVGTTARRTQPCFSQVFMAGAGSGDSDGTSAGARSGNDDLFAGNTAGSAAGGAYGAGGLLERQVFVVRKRIEHETEGIYFPSLSTRTIVYKGMLTAPQLRRFFADLGDQEMESALALVHSRFSTNTFPSWPLAHPYRYLAHNGEINTVAGNRNWMRAREALLESELIPGEIERILPVITPGASDSASFDEVLELLCMGGRSLPHAVLMMVPEAWENHATMDAERRAFYEFHASLMEPWDGPASIAFTDGTVIGAVLDRNGLRPSRYWVTDEGLVIMASEVGVLDVDPGRVVAKGRLRPGRMFLVDTSLGRIVDDDEIKAGLAGAHPYGRWLEKGLVHLDDLPVRTRVVADHASLVRRQQGFGYTNEDLRILMAPMARTGGEALGSMGSDTPSAVLSDRPRVLFDYFSQLFAQVTNPPLDAIREELVTSLGTAVGPQTNLLGVTGQACRQVVLPYPVIDNDDLAKLIHVNEDGEYPGLAAVCVSGLYEVSGGGPALASALESVRGQVSSATDSGARIIVLSDRNATETMAPIPSLLLVSAVHHHLIRTKQRTQVGLVIECGDAREVHHVALLIGYGAAAVNPYVAFDSIEEMVTSGAIANVDVPDALHNYIKALGKGVLKVMSKLGISTVASYTGAQTFEALGLSSQLIDEYFTGTVSRLEGIGLEGVASEVATRHHLAYPLRSVPAQGALGWGGEYQWRREGAYHLFNPETVFRLQHATRAGRYSIFKQYTQAVDDQAERLATLRGLFRLRRGVRPAVPIDEVEAVSEIVKRFATGAMSYGSISAEAHETLAIAMNRLGGKSNTGEGGEDSRRFVHDDNGDLRRSAIKQVASGRFGVTSEYLVNADDLQIKMAQGAKPGEGGQLPGYKVYPWIAATRHSTPGVGLISPPPHHDIYSIEDIAQLIHDLKNANPAARIHVKLVAEVGVGTVAAGVAKAHSDVVLISGHDGGTGASPLTSLKHAGGPWELGLAETQQTLLRNDLRDRIVVQVDGQLKTGRDVVVAALLGAEEFGFATAPLVVAGCIMMRVCHLDTCPVGVATQNPELRKRFSGQAEFVVRFFEFLAQEVREYLAEMGFRTLVEAVGHAELLDVTEAVSNWKAQGLDLSPIFEVPELSPEQARHCTKGQDHGLDRALDAHLIEICAPALEAGLPVVLDLPIANVNRTVGTMLGSALTQRHGGQGLPDDTITIHFTGSAGQSFGAFLPRGISMSLAGDANDYVGKGLSGGRLVLFPAPRAPFVAEDNIIAGNVCLYGATAGQAFFRGQVGERFCVRNSGAMAVVEGVGDHGCEYMTGGRVVVLGQTGRNFGAGMSGGIAYVWDPFGALGSNLNLEMVAIEGLQDDDREFLADAVGLHWRMTESGVASRLLEDWEVSLGQFVKIMPKDYRKVLEATRLATEQGLPIDDAIMAAARG